MRHRFRIEDVAIVRPFEDAWQPERLMFRQESFCTAAAEQLTSSRV